MPAGGPQANRTGPHRTGSHRVPGQTEPCSPPILRFRGERRASSRGAWTRRPISVGRCLLLFSERKAHQQVKTTTEPPVSPTASLSLGCLRLWGLLRGRVSGHKGVVCKSHEECSKALQAAPTHIPGAEGGGDTQALRGLLPGTPPPGVASWHGDQTARRLFAAGEPSPHCVCAGSPRGGPWSLLSLGSSYTTSPPCSSAASPHRAQGGWALTRRGFGVGRTTAGGI